MDVKLRAAEQAFRRSATPANKARLEQAQLRAGYEEEYVPCKRCKPDTRTVMSHGRAVLCDQCCGNGWTDIVLVPPSCDPLKREISDGTR